MKKVKLIMMMLVLSIVLCACGGKNAQDSSVDSKGETEVSQENKEDKKEKNSAKAETFECLSELKDAAIEDGLIQVHDVILRTDWTMTVGEVVSAYENSGEDYTFWIPDYDAGNLQAESLSLDKLTGPDEQLTFFVYKDDVSCAQFSVYNPNDQISKASECIITYVAPLDSVNTYYAKGIRGDGEGIMYEDIREMFPEYADKMKEDLTYDGNIRVTFEYNGSMGLCMAIFCFDSKDGSCISASL